MLIAEEDLIDAGFFPVSVICISQNLVGNVIIDDDLVNRFSTLSFL